MPIYGAPANAASPTGFGEIASLQAIGQQLGAGRARQLSRCGKDLCGSSVPGGVPFRKNADSVSRLQMPQAGLHRIRSGRAFSPCDRLDKPKEDAGNKSLPENVLTRNIIQRKLWKAHGEQKRIPIRYVIGHDQAGAVDLRVVVLQGKKPTDWPPKKRTENAPNPSMPIKRVHSAPSFTPIVSVLLPRSKNNKKYPRMIRGYFKNEYPQAFAASRSAAFRAASALLILFWFQTE